MINRHLSLIFRNSSLTFRSGLAVHFSLVPTTYSVRAAQPQEVSTTLHKKVKKLNLHYTRGIASKRVTSDGIHLRGSAPGQHSSEETSHRCLHCVRYYRPGNRTLRIDSNVLTTELTEEVRSRSLSPGPSQVGRKPTAKIITL